MVSSRLKNNQQLILTIYTRDLCPFIVSILAVARNKTYSPNKSVFIVVSLLLPSCADPESYVRGCPHLTMLLFFFYCFMRGGMTQRAIIGRPAKRHFNEMAFRWPANDGPTLKWRFAGLPMMAQH